MQLLSLFNFFKNPNNSYFRRLKRWKTSQLYNHIFKKVKLFWIVGLTSTLVFSGPLFFAVLSTICLLLTFSSFQLLEIPDNFQ